MKSERYETKGKFYRSTVAEASTYLSRASHYLTIAIYFKCFKEDDFLICEL